jgi:hypothetical protein
MKTLCPYLLAALAFAALLLCSSLPSPSGAGLDPSGIARHSNCVLVTPQGPAFMAAALCR